MSKLLYGKPIKVQKTPSGKFKVGDYVQTTASAIKAGCCDERFIVAEIFMDCAGCVLLKEPDGYGYGEHNCEQIAE